ncbi:MAG: ABC transporter ATP-binding protein [SAR324 cluster bacterium]|nr:ABC transporter ATP-binding protein [SAR324 cluster bacterium]
MALLKIEELYKHFPIHGGIFLREQGKASVINNISLEINEGEILGIVGESGCGKSTLARLVMRIYEPTAGKIYFGNTLIEEFPRKEYFHQVQMVFQDPFSSLNSKMTVDALLTEMLLLHQPSVNIQQTKTKLLEEVGLSSNALKKYPHEFSGGQRQRIAIAKALSANPTLLIADEPVSALDVSIQAQILNLLMDLQQQHQLSLLFISHDLEVVNYFCDRILVMYLGKIVEELPHQNLHSQACHPYTRALLQSIPHIDKKTEGLQTLRGEIPSPLDLPAGCGFYSRCPYRQEDCLAEAPPLLEELPQHKVACYHIT